MTTSPPGADPSVVSERAALVCARCGYELRGLRREARCPECGTPVSQSVYGDWLLHQEPQWLACLRLGAAIAVLAQTGWLAINGYWLSAHGSYGWRVLRAQGPLVGMAVPIALTVLDLVATLLLTTPRPQHAERPITSRRLLRAGVLLTAVMGTAGYLPVMYQRPQPQYWLAFGLLSAGTTLAWGLYLSGLALRIPNATLAFETLLCALLSAMVWSLLYVVPWITRGRSGRAEPIAQAARRSPLEIALWCAGLYVLVVTFRYYRAFTAAGVAAAASIPRSGAS